MKDIKQELVALPHALREMLEKGRPEYEALIRQTRWGDGPIFVAASGAEQVLALTARYAFESLLGWPVVAREAMEFVAYSQAVLRPRSVLLAVSDSGEMAAALEAARAARARGAIVLALTRHPESSLAGLAEGTFLIRGAGEGTSLVGPQATLGYVALLAALTLKRHRPQLVALEDDFTKLPTHLEWILTQLGDAVQAFATELRGLRNLHVVGSGFYHPVALRWAHLLKTEAGVAAEGFPPGDLASGFLARPSAEVALAFVSGSHCHLKKTVHELAAAAKKAGAKVLAVTDRNDRELSARATLAVLLPELSEMVGATLALALLEWVGYHVIRGARTGPKRAAASSVGRSAGQGERPRRT